MTQQKEIIRAVHQHRVLPLSNLYDEHKASGEDVKALSTIGALRTYIHPESKEEVVTLTSLGETLLEFYGEPTYEEVWWGKQYAKFGF